MLRITVITSSLMEPYVKVTLYYIFFLDFGEAFDTIDHSILLNKSYKYVIR